MGRQVVKGLTMLMLIIGLTFATAVVTNGQSDKQVIAQVPFDFIVTNKTLRSGEYHVRIANGAGDALAIRNEEGKDQVLRLSYETGPAKDQGEKQAKLVFHRYGNTYFLSQVWMAGENTGRELPRTRQERAIERELTAIAANRGRNISAFEIVEVLATVR